MSRRSACLAQWLLLDSRQFTNTVKSLYWLSHTWILYQLFEETKEDRLYLLMIESTS